MGWWQRQSEQKSLTPARGAQPRGAHVSSEQVGARTRSLKSDRNVTGPGTESRVGLGRAGPGR